MFGRTCEREREVLAAMRAGGGDPSLREHAASCEACREACAVEEWMQRFAALQAEPPRLPDPGMLWWKAQLLRRWDAERRAASPLETGQHVQVGVGLAGCAALVVWLWPRVSDWGARAATSDASAWAALAPSILTITIVVGGLVAAATAIVAIKGIFAD